MIILSQFLTYGLRNQEIVFFYYGLFLDLYEWQLRYLTAKRLVRCCTKPSCVINMQMMKLCLSSLSLMFLLDQHKLFNRAWTIVDNSLITHVLPHLFALYKIDVDSSQANVDLTGIPDELKPYSGRSAYSTSYFIN